MLPGADPGFPVRGGANPRRGGGTPTYDFAKISGKLHEIEKILGRTGVAGAHRGRPLRSTTGYV